MEREKLGKCGCAPEGLPDLGREGALAPGNSGVTFAYEVGPFNLPARLVERTVPQQPVRRTTLSPAFNAVLAEMAHNDVCRKDDPIGSYDGDNLTDAQARGQREFFRGRTASGLARESRHTAVEWEHAHGNEQFGRKSVELRGVLEVGRI